MKKLLAIAVAAALVAPAAAMADTTLYGKLHTSYGQIKYSGAAGASAKTTGVESHSSRIGVKGSTALDNGMEATYGLEYGINIDGDNNGTAQPIPATGNASTNTAPFTARNQFVGLKGNFGEVRVGRHDTPAKLATAGQDVFADTYADMGAIIATDNHRVNNAVAYINKFGPVGFAAAHSTGTGLIAAAGDNEVDANTLMGNYSNGPWYAGLGYTKVKTAAELVNAGAGWKSEAGHQVNVVLENAKATGTSGKSKNALINGVYKVGNVSLKAQYGEGSNSGFGAGLNGKEKLTTVGADYNLGKKTSVYAIYSEDKNLARVSDAAAATNLNVKAKAMAVGLVTEF